LIRLPASAARIAAMLVCVTAALPACVIPLGPDFSDPPAPPSVPPYIVSGVPDQGSLVAGTTSFQVWVTDLTPPGPLTVRWYADFPPLQGDTRAMGADIGIIRPGADGTIQNFLLQATLGCVPDNLVPDIDQHTVTVVISDSMLPGAAAPTTPFDGTHEVTATWTVLLPCRTSTGP